MTLIQIFDKYLSKIISPNLITMNIITAVNSSKTYDFKHNHLRLITLCYYTP